MMIDVKKPTHFMYALIGLSILIGLIIALYIVTNKNDEDEFDKGADSDRTYVVETQKAEFEMKYNKDTDTYYIYYKGGTVDIDELNAEIERIAKENIDGKVVYDIPSAALPRDTDMLDLDNPETIEKLKQERINREKLKDGSGAAHSE